MIKPENETFTAWCRLLDSFLVIVNFAEPKVYI